MDKKTIHQEPIRTPEQIAREKELRAKLQREKPSIKRLVESGDYHEPVNHGDYLALMEFMARIRDLREKQSLPLSEIASRTGIDKSAISRLENGITENPTFWTLERLARSVGKRLRIELDDAVGLDS